MDVHTIILTMYNKSLYIYMNISGYINRNVPLKRALCNNTLAGQKTPRRTPASGT